MAIEYSTLEGAAFRFSQRRARNLAEARVLGLKTVFLCHSHRDSSLVQGFEQLLKETGWSVYVDWQDAEMPETPNRETARRIQEKIVQLDYFIFLATANSMNSRWCPWEIGYADGKKDLSTILVVPTTDGVRTHGNEYLDLYRRIDHASVPGRLGVWFPKQTQGGVWVESL